MTLPDAACGSCQRAIYCATSPDRDAQLAAFEREHPQPQHRRVRKLADAKGDPSWNWTPPDDVRVRGGRL